MTLFPIGRRLSKDSFLNATFGSHMDKVMAGGTPANPAKLAPIS